VVWKTWSINSHRFAHSLRLLVREKCTRLKFVPNLSPECGLVGFSSSGSEETVLCSRSSLPDRKIRKAYHCPQTFPQTVFHQTLWIYLSHASSCLRSTSTLGRLQSLRGLRQKSPYTIHVQMVNVGWSRTLLNGRYVFSSGRYKVRNRIKSWTVQVHTKGDIFECKILD
jgi:hypothetical protein